MFKISSRALLLTVLTLLASRGLADPPSTAPAKADDAKPVDLDELARSVAGEGAMLTRADRLVQWMSENFEWTTTDYERRTVEQIIARGGGNCAEQARVLARLLDGAEVTSRWTKEINIHPRSDRRQRNAQSRIEERGPRASVFGYMHNDHRWLEVYDDAEGRWVPSDPTMGIFGLDDWVEKRLGFMGRHELGEDQLAPFVVITGEAGSVDRTEHYLIESFNAHYEGVLATLPAWEDWVRGVGELSKLAARAFAGEVNLHEHRDQIESLEQVYLALKDQYLEERGIDSDWQWSGTEH